MKSLKEYIAESEFTLENPVPGDVFGLELSTDVLIESVVGELLEDGSPVVELDARAIEIMESMGWVFEDVAPVPTDSISPIHGNAFAPYHREHDPREWFRKDVHEEEQDEEAEDETVTEAEYRGRKVPLGKPMAGDVKKKKVYVRKPNGSIVKVNFGHGGTSAKKAGQKTMRIKKSNPARRKSFRARHNCDNPGPRWKARYWSCRAW
jgi:hypothetical protein